MIMEQHIALLMIMEQHIALLGSCCRVDPEVSSVSWVWCDIIRGHSWVKGTDSGVWASTQVHSSQSQYPWVGECFSLWSWAVDLWIGRLAVSRRCCILLQKLSQDHSCNFVPWQTVYNVWLGPDPMSCLLAAYRPITDLKVIQQHSTMKAYLNSDRPFVNNWRWS